VSAREVLMCRPTQFTVSYSINPWMHPDVPTDTSRALAQWDALHRIYLDLGFTVHLVDPLPGLPDMVYAANGGLVFDGTAYGARFRHAQRRPEAPAYSARLADLGLRVVEAAETNEGEGDILMVGGRFLAGSGFRTDPAAHEELRRVSGREVVTLRLVDPRFYHLDTALAVVDGERDLVAYLPAAFDGPSRERLEALYPDAILASERDAEVFGMNAYGDGERLVVAAQAVDFPAQLRERGVEPIPVDLSELLLGGGGVKCCTLELRR